MATKNPPPAIFTRPSFERAEALDAGQPDAKSRRFRVLVSTEAPVDRLIVYEGEFREARERLIHDNGSPDLSRLDTPAGIPVLRGHDSHVQIGQVRAPVVEGRRLYSEFEIFTDTPEGREAISQIDNRYALGASVRYSIQDTDVVELDEKGPDGRKVLNLNVRAWGVLEVSLVSIPADVSAGVMRDATATRSFRDASRVLNLGGGAKTSTRETQNMSTEETAGAANGAPPTPPPVAKPAAEATRAADGAPPRVSPEARDAEEEAAAERIAVRSTILTHSKREAREKTADAIVADFAGASPEVRAKVAERAQEFVNNPHDTEVGALKACHAIINLSHVNASRGNAELAQYAGLNSADFAQALQSDDPNSAARHFSEEVLRANVGDSLKDRFQSNKRSILVPLEVAQGRTNTGSRTAFTAVDTTGVGGSSGTGNADNSVEYDEWKQEWYEASLRDDLPLAALGISREVTNNNLIYPVQSGIGTAGFYGETEKITDTIWSYTTRTTAPHRYGAAVAWSRRRQMQDRVSLTAQIATELANATAYAYELAVIAGTGTNNQPQGIFGTTGVGSYSFGTSLLGGAITKEHLLQMQLDLKVANLSGTPRILTTPHVELEARLTPLGTLNAPSEATLASIPIGGGNTMLSFPYTTSNLMPTDRTKGTGDAMVSNLHTLLFGNFSNVVAIDYGIVEITLDDVTLARNNMFQLVYNAWMDVHLRRPSSLIAVEDIQI